jgi:hypothetical protein
MTIFIISSSNPRFNKNATRSTQLSTGAIMAHLHDLKQKLDQMHKIVITSLSTKREPKRPRLFASRAHANFAVGDFVLVAAPAQFKIPKLMPRWTGPYRMTRTITDWVYEVQHLVTAKKSEVHTSRLQFYSDNKLNVHIQLTQQIQHDEWEFHVERIESGSS